MNLPRVMLAAPYSGSGKTLVTCGLLQALQNRSVHAAAFKCGPDYIDPMFHTKVIGTPSRNLDTFFADRKTVRYLFSRQAAKADCSVMEGVMGYYDGVAGITTQASAYDLADQTDTPVLFVVNARGMSLSVVPYIKGFLEYKENSHIKGVILNRISPSLYPDLKRMIEAELPVTVYGYVPKVADCVIESRHLGLVTPGEIRDLKERLMKLAGILEETLDLDGILALAASASPYTEEDFAVPEAVRPFLKTGKRDLTLAVARDEAFCFYYADNLDLLRDLGAEPVFFSPLHDSVLPKSDGLLLGGGYPELYAEQLSANESMKASIRSAIENGMPYLAECGGFMYLHESMEDMEHKAHAMVGIVKGHVRRTEALNRFGYIQLTANTDSVFGPAGGTIPAHEFHYFDSSLNGDSFHAQKPHRKRNWDCILADEVSAVGFPHLYYYGNPEFAARFVDCLRKRKR